MAGYAFRKGSCTEMIMAREPQVYAGLAALSGAVLALATDWNSQLARLASPLFASFVAHGVGTAASVALFVALPVWRKPSAPSGVRPPLWAWLGGVPGALTVAFATVTILGPLGLAGTLAAMLVGQMLFGVLTDRFGWLGLERRRLDGRTVAGLALVVFGGGLVIAGLQ